MENLYIIGKLEVGKYKPNTPYKRIQLEQELKKQQIADIFTTKTSELPELGVDWRFESPRRWWKIAQFNMWMSHFKSGSKNYFGEKVKLMMLCRKNIKNYKEVLLDSKNSNTIKWRRVETLSKWLGVPELKNVSGSDRKGEKILNIRVVDLDKLESKVVETGMTELEIITNLSFSVIITINPERVRGFRYGRERVQEEYSTKLFRVGADVWELPEYITKSHIRVEEKSWGNPIKALQQFGTRVSDNWEYLSI